MRILTNDHFRLRKTVLRHVVRARLTGLSIPQGVSQVEAASGDKVTSGQSVRCAPVNMTF